MARMIPPRLAPETPDSERRVYQRFQLAPPPAWTVFHSQRFLLPQRRRTQEGELDFLVLDPSRGAIGLEVKGGWVQRTAAGWSSVDRHGKQHAIKDPGQQATSAIHAIAKYWEQAPGFGGKGFRCGYGWGIVLPDVECPGDLGPDLPRDVIMDRSDLMNVEKAMDRIFRSLGNLKTSLSAPGVKALVATLRVRCPPASSLALQFKEDNEKLWRLTEEQTTVLDSLAAHNRAAIEGSAGTGKTVLAMEKARRLATTGKRVLLLCFNEPLARDLSQQADGFGVETFHGFGRRLAQRAGLGRFEPEQPDIKDSRITFYTQEAPMILLEALEQLPDERYDAIVVDEAQDFLPDWWPCLDSALRHGREGTLYAFYDPNQRIYEGGPPEALEVIEHKLVHNCRNTRRIASYAAGLVGTESRVRAGAPEGRPVERINCDSDAEVVQKIADRLERLVLKEAVAPDTIAIVSTRTLKNSPFSDNHRAGRFVLVNLDDHDNRGQRSGAPSPKRQVVFETLYRFKGLERDVVILLDLPAGDRDVSANHLYVAASRARNLLVVVRRVR